METKENENIITLDSLISVSIVSNSKEKRYNYYLVRSDLLEGSMMFKLCNPKSDTLIVKESLFIIKNRKEQSDDISLKQAGSEIYYNTSLFHLQHFISRKYLTIYKNNNHADYSLKLVDNDMDANLFTFKQIIDSKSTVRLAVNFNQPLYLSVYLPEKSTFYYLNILTSQNDSSNLNTGLKHLRSFNLETENKNKETLEAAIKSEFLYKFYILNQVNFLNNERIFSGDLINIVFTGDTKLKKMLCLGVKVINKSKTGNFHLKEEEIEDIALFNLDIYNNEGDYLINKMKMKNDIQKEEKYNIGVFPYQHDDHYFHVNNNTYWVIEDDDWGTIKSNVGSGDRVRIKNLMLGQYLAIVKDTEDKLIFKLVSESQLYMKNSFLIGNFELKNYAINMTENILKNNAKIVLKTVMSDIAEVVNKINLTNIYNEFKPISLNQNADFKYIESEDDFIFELKKTPILTANEPIYIKKLIDHLDNFLMNLAYKHQKNSRMIELMKRNLTFFTNYLMNVEYSFIDHNLNMNYPIRYRQELLINHNILPLINKITKFFTTSAMIVEEKEVKEKLINLQLKDLIKQILLFLIYLSDNNQSIKIKIFKELKDLLVLSKNILKNKSTLLFCVTKLLSGSRLLQEAILEEKETEKIFMKPNKEFERYKDTQHVIQVTVTLNNLFELILSCKQYFYYFKKILNFDKNRYHVTFKTVLKNLLKNEEENLKLFLDTSIESLLSFFKEENKNSEEYKNTKIFLEELKKLKLDNFLFTKETLLLNLLLMSSVNKQDTESKNKFQQIGTIRSNLNLLSGNELEIPLNQESKESRDLDISSEDIELGAINKLEKVYTENSAESLLIRLKKERESELGDRMDTLKSDNKHLSKLAYEKCNIIIKFSN
jgi:hypothetical protein